MHRWQRARRRNAISRLADQAGVSDVSLRSDSASTEGSFQVTGLSMQGRGSMRQISQMVYLLESASTPLRITSMQISPRRARGARRSERSGKSLDDLRYPAGKDFD